MADAGRMPRWARWTATGCAVALVGATAYLVIDARPSSAATSGLRTATVTSGSVTQSIDLSGSVERVDQVGAAFRTTGTVTAVKVGVGDHVRAGRVLATLATAPLQRAVTVAQANLVAAQASLDAASSSASAATTAPTSTTPTSSTRSTSPSSGGRPGGGSGTVDTSPLKHATSSVQKLLDAAATACAPVLGDTPAPPSPTPTPTPTATPTATPTTVDTASPTPTPSDTPTPTSTATPTDTPSPTPSGPTAEQVSACVKALSEAMGAARQTASTIDQLAALIAKAATALQNQQSTTGSTGTTSGTAGSGASGSGPSRGGGTTASLEVSVLQATQALASAQQDLAGAVLRAPIAGTVGSVGLVKGDQASTSSAIVVVGAGAATVTVDLPLAQLGKVRVAQDVSVTPAGTTDEVAGLVQSIGVLPTSTTSTSPTYPVQIAVSDAPVTLASGSLASARITLATATDVLTVPVSALAGVASGTGAVEVLSGSTTTVTRVTVGAVGDGLAQISEGLTAGQVVVLANPSVALPTGNTLQRRFGGTGGGVSSLTGGGGFGGGPPGR